MKAFIKKFSAIFLGFCLLLSVVPVTLATAMSYNRTLSLNTSTSVSGRVVFSFVAPHAGTYNFFSTGSVDTTGTLYNSSDSQLAYDDDSSDGSNFMISQRLGANQRVYLVTAPLSSSSSYYTVKVEVQVQTMSLNTDYTVSGQKRFLFTASQTATYKFFSTGSLDTTGTLYNSSNTQLSYNDQGGEGSNKDNFLITYNLTSGQTVYLVTAPYFSSDNTLTYTVRVEEQMQAMSLNTNYTVSGQKRFSFTAPQTASYKFFSTGSVDTEATLYSSSNTQLSYNDQDGDGSNFLVTYNLTSGQTVILVTEPYYSDNTTSYKVRVEYNATQYSNQSMALDTDYTAKGNSSFTFTAPQCGIYVFTSTGSVDTIATLLNGGNQLDYNDNSGSGSNFLIEYQLSKGQTVQLNTYPWSSSYSSDPYIVTATFQYSNHSNWVWVTQKAATCTRTGVRAQKCAASGCTYVSRTETIPKTNHTWRKVDKTYCDKAGVRTFTCTVCKETKTEALAATGHKWVKTKEVAPTYDAYGKRTFTCSVCKGTTTTTLAKLAKTSLSNAKITIKDSSTNIKKPSVTVKLGSKNLVNGTDYTVSYKNAGSGKVTVTIVGIKKYKGSASATFVTNPPISQTKITIKDVTYNGKSQKPTVTVKYNGKTLKKDKDYTLSYKNNKKVGTATVTVKGKGIYTGSVKKTFKINPKKVSGLKLSSPDCGRLNINWKKASGINGYEIKYSYSSDFSYDVKTVKIKKPSTTSLKIRGVYCSDYYYVKIRAYKTVGGKKYYSSYSSTKKIFTE